MRRLFILLLVLLLPLVTVPPPARAADTRATPGLPAHRVADPNAPPVTAKNLIAADRFWPYHVVLVHSWTPPGRTQPLRAGTRGVLIRVEPSGTARIDFGRDGLFAVPVGQTDLVAQAERVRRGQLLKTAPNFALAIGPRLLDPATKPLRPVEFAQTAQRRGFLAVFADPSGEGFPALAKSLAPLRAPDGVLTIFLPSTNQSDESVAEQLRSLEWSVPFVMGNSSEAYTRTLLPDGVTLPAALLQTSEGRLLYQGRWSPDGMPELSAALEKAFSGPPR
jgi:hypothetical protein